MAEPVQQFARNLRERRVRAGLSQEALARATDLHRTEISLLERARREPRLSTLVRLGRAFDCHLSSQTGRDEDTRPTTT